MRTIYKFPIAVRDSFEIVMPAGATILHVAPQAGVPCLWALVETNAPPVTRAFQLRGTGHSCERLEQCRYVGSFLMHGDALVFHLFEEP